MIASLLLPYQVPSVPVRLQRRGGADAFFTLRKKPVEKSVQYANSDTLEAGQRVLPGEVVISDGVNKYRAS